MSISIEQGTFITAADSYNLDLDPILFPSAQAAPTVVVVPQDTNGNYNVFIFSMTKVGGSWRVTFGISGKPDGNITIAYRAITRTI